MKTEKGEEGEEEERIKVGGRKEMVEGTKAREYKKVSGLYVGEGKVGVMSTEGRGQWKTGGMEGEG